MFQAGPILDELYSALDATEPEAQAKVRRTLNLAYFDIARKAPFVGLRRMGVTFNFANADSDGLLMPSDLAGIMSVRSASYGPYEPREAAHAVETTDAVRRYFISAVTATPLVHAKGLSIDKGSTAITFSPALADAAASIGEFLSIAGRMGLYKIASAGVLESVFMDEKVSNDWYQIRPAGTMKLKLLDETGAESGDVVTIDYWRQPLPIYSPSDMILLPTTEALYLRTVMRFYGTVNFDEKKADNYRIEFREALAACIDAVPSHVSPMAPRNRTGGTNLWGSQG